MPPHLTTFYVYVLARPNGRPFYVGKGKGKRVFVHDQEARTGCTCRKCNTIRKIWRQGGEVQRYTVFTTDDEQEAYTHEAELIAQYGLSALANQATGGKGGASGVPRSANARERISAAKRKAFEVPEMREQTRANTTAQWADPDIRAKMCGALKAAQNTPEVQAKRDAALEKQWSDPEARARKSAQSKAMWADPEFRARMSAKLSERNRTNWADPDYRARMSAMLADQASDASKASQETKKRKKKESTPSQ
jgi:hypothetical protein